MLKNPKEWLSLVSQGESETLALKNRLPVDDAVARTLSAFANTSGGTLILGIGKQGKLIGLPDKEVDEAVVKLHNIASSLFSFPFEYGSFDLGGRHLVYASVGRVPEHLFPVTTSNGAAFARQGSTTVGLSLEDAIDKQQQVVPRTRTSKSKRTAQEEQKRTSLVVFVAMSFRFEEEPALVDYFRAIERAVEQSGTAINLKRMDLIEGDFEISSRLMDEIDASHIVIADFTLKPANVYFELGYARGRQKRVIQIARKGTSLEFDINHWRTLFYRNATDLEAKLIPAFKSAYEEFNENGSSAPF
jgi:hypothetical protein